MVTLNYAKAEDLVELIRWINSQGWSPATSTNYSFRNSEEPASIAISKSGIDKSKFDLQDLMLIDLNAKPFPAFEGIKSSAETLLHTVLYQELDEVEFILHTHSVNGTILSQKYLEQGELILENYEVLKGLPGINTHEVSVSIPIFDNTQDIAALSEDFRVKLKAYSRMPAYLIAGHGLYTWGKSIEAAKRHLELLEFLLECEYRKLCFKM
jgi:methylthioribulose-1-phosphate dehydratase